MFRKKLQYACISMILSLSISSMAQSLSINSRQTVLESDVRSLLNQAYILESAFYAENGYYSQDAGALGLTVPHYLEDIGVLQLSLVTSNDFSVSFAVKQGNTYSINKSGLIGNMIAYASLQEIDQKIKSDLAGIYAAEKAYFVEWERYSTSFQELGVGPFQIASTIGNYSVKVTVPNPTKTNPNPSPTFIATFTPNALLNCLSKNLTVCPAAKTPLYGIDNKLYQINEQKNLTIKKMRNLP